MSEKAPPRSTLRIRDLKQRKPERNLLLNLRVPASLLAEIAEVATTAGTTKRDVIIAFLNVGLDTWRARKR